MNKNLLLTAIGGFIVCSANWLLGYIAGHERGYAKGSNQLNEYVTDINKENAMLRKMVSDYHEELDKELSLSKKQIMDLNESIKSAREAGVPEDQILHDIEEINDYFCN